MTLVLVRKHAQKTEGFASLIQLRSFMLTRDMITLVKKRGFFYDDDDDALAFASANVFHLSGELDKLCGK